MVGGGGDYFALVFTVTYPVFPANKDTHKNQKSKMKKRSDWDLRDLIEIYDCGCGCVLNEPT